MLRRWCRKRAPLVQLSALPSAAAAAPFAARGRGDLEIDVVFCAAAHANRADALPFDPRVRDERRRASPRAVQRGRVLPRRRRRPRAPLGALSSDDVVASVCCPATCGRCGGVDCWTQPGGEDCCARHVYDRKVPCLNEGDVGCVLPLAAPSACRSPPPRSASTRGAWRTRTSRVASSGRALVPAQGRLGAVRPLLLVLRVLVRLLRADARRVRRARRRRRRAPPPRRRARRRRFGVTEVAAREAAAAAAAAAERAAADAAASARQDGMMEAVRAAERRRRSSRRSSPRRRARRRRRRRRPPQRRRRPPPPPRRPASRRPAAAARRRRRRRGGAGRRCGTAAEGRGGEAGGGAAGGVGGAAARARGGPRRARRRAHRLRAAVGLSPPLPAALRARRRVTRGCAGCSSAAASRLRRTPRCPPPRRRLWPQRAVPSCTGRSRPPRVFGTLGGMACNGGGARNGSPSARRGHDEPVQFGADAPGVRR